MNNTETLYCPFTFSIPPHEFDEGTYNCMKEKCAWWNVEGQQCAMMVLAESLRKQVKR